MLLSVDKDRVPEIERVPSFVLASEVGIPDNRVDVFPVALRILVGVVLTQLWKIYLLL